jgi:UV DNA damage endonuclease
MPTQFGYCCINLTLSSHGITTSRTMRKASFEKLGIVHASRLALENVQNLAQILQWNADHDIHVFRMGSGFFPWSSEYDIRQLPDFPHISDLLAQAGAFARETSQRLTFHPDHFVKLASLNDIVAMNSVQEINHHDEIFTLLGFPPSHVNCINIHVGQNFSLDTVERFIARFHLLSPTAQQRLVVENDDKANAFSVRQLYTYLYQRIHTPITFDYFHHEFHPDGLTSQEAAHLAAQTWDVRPLFHYSESKNLHENINGNPRAHSDYIRTHIDAYGLDIDVDLECKAKELALLSYRKEHGLSPTSLLHDTSSSLSVGAI